MIIKRCCSVLLICFCSIPASSQEPAFVYNLNDDFNIVDKSKSTITGKAYSEDRLLRLDCVANKTGFKVLTAHFTDSSLNTLQGLFQSYYPAGKIESEGDYVKNAKQGAWQYWDKKGLKTDSVIFENDTRILYAKFYYYDTINVLSYLQITDSLQNKFYEKHFSNTGKIESEVKFLGQNGILKTYDSAGIKTDTVYTKVEEEAQFPGGNLEWTRYLQKALDVFNPAENGAPDGKYQVIVRFIVSADGSISNVMAEKKFGYGMEKKVVEIIEKGPRWIPAKQYGKYVNAYRRQPVTFVVEGQGKK